MTQAEAFLNTLDAAQTARLAQLLEPIAPNQFRLWIDQELDRDSNAYNVSRQMHLRGRLNAQALAQALSALAERHQVLRTVFLDAGDSVRQLVLDPEPIPLEPVTGNPDPDHPETARQNREFLHRPFDLRLEPPMRARLVRLAQDNHLLLIVFHHIAVDGWSLALFERELTDAYASFASSGTWLPQPSPTQYQEFSRWQRDRLDPALVEEQISFWRERLPAQPSASLLATPALRTPTAGPVATVTHTVPPEVLRALGNLTDTRNVSLFAVLQAAVQIVAQRYTGEPAVALSSTTLNRKLPQFESTIGFFVNTVTLFTDLSDDPGFQEAVSRAAVTVREALSHDDVPFDQVVTRLGTGRPSRIALELQDAAASSAHWWGELDVHSTSPDDQRAKFDLALFFLREGASLQLLVEYDCALLDEAIVSSFVRSVLHLITHGARDGDLPISQLELMGDDDSETLRRRHTGAAPRDDVLPTSQAITELAALGDARAAVRAGQEAIGFTELVRRAHWVAHRLTDISPGAFVGVIADRSVHSIVAVLGIWLARGAYVPIDPALPADRRHHMITDADLAIVCGPASFDAGTAEVVDPRQLEQPGWPQDLPRARTEPDDIAYAIYTSGTTGLPKATMTTHANMLNFMAGLRETYGIDNWQDEVASLNAPLIFDVSVQQILALLGGAGLVIIPADLRLDPQALLDHVAATGITLFECIPPHLQLLVEAGLLTRTDLALRRLVTGGEALPAPLWEPLSQARHLRVFNVYGPTECTVNSTAQEVGPETERPVIGRALPGVSLFVADSQGRLVPDGAVGELHIGGAGVGAGYLNRPDLNASAWITHPWDPEGAPLRVYRTGDRVRIAKGRVVEYLGRLDSQVKIRGNRVELGEITARLLTHPHIRSAVTIAVPDERRGLTLHAFATLTGPTPERALLEHLRAFLPTYMVPAAVHILERLPVTIIGKLDHRALEAHAAAAELSGPYTDARAEPPADPTEHQLCQAWSQLLGTPGLDPHAHFFAHGGHSLLAARLLARVRRELGAQMTFNDLVEAPTPRLLAARLNRRGNSAARQNSRTYQPSARSNVLLMRDVPDDVPLVLLHPLGGDVFIYRDLVEHLPPERAVYAVFDGYTDVPTARTWPGPQEMVNAYAADVAQHLAGRDCHLAGWSMGGLLAHATTAALEDLGVHVRSVTLWDCGVAADPTERAPEPDWHEGALAVLYALSPTGEASSLTDLSASWYPQTPQQCGPWIVQTSERLWPGAAPSDPDALGARAVVSALHHWLFGSWQPPTVAAPLHVIWAGDSLDRELLTRTDWRRYTHGAVHEERVEATHFSIVEQPVVKTLASALATTLDVTTTDGTR